MEGPRDQTMFRSAACRKCGHAVASDTDPGCDRDKKPDSKGPFLFQQARIGRDNEMFEVVKFRSMRTDTADRSGDRSAARDDDRITRV